MNEEIKKVDALSDDDKQKYDLTKDEAIRRLKKSGVTESESDQMLLLWCRKGLIDAVRVSKGPVSGRGVRVSSLSLEGFIAAKRGSVESILEKLQQEQRRNEILQKELNRANERLRKYEEDGYVLKKEKTKKVNLTEVKLESADKNNIKLRFKYDRAGHIAEFDEDQMLSKLRKRTRKGWVDVNEISNSLRQTLEDLCRQYK